MIERNEAVQKVPAIWIASFYVRKEMHVMKHAMDVCSITYISIVLLIIRARGDGDVQDGNGKPVQGDGGVSPWGWT